MIDNAARDTGFSNQHNEQETDKDRLEERRKPGATENAGSDTGRGPQEAPASPRSGVDHLGSRNLDKLTEDERPRNFSD